RVRGSISTKRLRKRPNRLPHLLHKQLRCVLNNTIRKPQHRVAQALEMRVPARVPSGLARLRVHAAIQFHDQPPLRAVEIDNVRTERVLAAEFEALELDAP